jgi:hypothetical protein
MKEIYMKKIYIKEINTLAVRGSRWVGKAALLSVGLVAMVALVVVMGVLTAVMLIATALPVAAVRHEGELKDKRGRKNTSEISAPREKAVTS